MSNSVTYRDDLLRVALGHKNATCTYKATLYNGSGVILGRGGSVKGLGPRPPYTQVFDPSCTTPTRCRSYRPT